ncbi:MAG: sulfite reductase subunit C [Coriobacteriaceae bacterium]|uniref:sulfite reductase subunit C n=1 Tax=Tractidigestivibacter sp. TaxID=2847320 RepID=UPI002A8317DF|nr:sulfite reductase subunit C [Tractidigestivibacter sp.]MCI6274667.1 sulfite reductase subunit C [Coriobacteriaceae bacterium]MCI7439124.1 sulfite reductase subunit C [Coriobacteriaceae bacterium]MDD7584400.1 sulfite reductase subunit C [Coriobacteriaceae bacterium]MDY4534012.1 sulfite reductase subunit C [Tractidigestivibacter sp.]MDY5272039.1 sulfite reductase subunit C [Tractidigestivibacter sp.]
MQDINIKKLQNNCFRQSKVAGEFMLQLRVPGGLIDADLLDIIKHVCNTWGDGKFHIGTRMTLNATGIKYEDIPAVNAYIQPYLERVEKEMCGVEMETDKGYPYIAPRNIVACIGGAHCIKAAQNTQKLAHALERILYPNPYHIKVNIAGCPNDCAKAHFADFGIIGCTKPIYDQDRCIGCSSCVNKCKKAATRVLSLNEQTHKVEKDACCCVGCGECVSVCPTGAWRRPDKEYWKIVLGGRTGKQYPRMGQMFANWLTTDTVLQIFANWPKFSEWVLGGKPLYIHGGHLIDRAGYHKFKEKILEGVTLNPEALIADQVHWTEKEYRSNIHVKALADHVTVKDA